MKHLMVMFPVLFLSFGIGNSSNFVNIDHFGSQVDTICTVDPYRFMIFIENDVKLSGISLGLHIYSPDGATWTLDDAGGFEATPYGRTFVTGVPGSRWMSGGGGDGSCWDLSGTLVNDSLAPDQILITGSALESGLDAGGLEHMLDLRFTAGGVTGAGNVKTLCIDSLFYPPTGEFIFDPGGVPLVNLPKCWPVTECCYLCPEWDPGIPTTMEIVHCNTGQVTVSATDQMPVPGITYYLDGVTGGGTATVGLYSGVVTYVPAPSDIGQPVYIFVEATLPNYRQGACAGLAWEIEVTVTNSPPVIDCGRWYNNVAVIGDVFGKGDIAGFDQDDCDNLTYFAESVDPTPNGLYSVDTLTGEFRFWADDGDQGIVYEFCVGAADVHDTAICCFDVVILQGNNPGDVNLMDDVNVADAVALVDYIFRGGWAPVNMNWADVNADCRVNIADVVYIIEYIFKGGPEPQLGCVYQ